jgi:hypothetical protein
MLCKLLFLVSFIILVIHLYSYIAINKELEIIKLDKPVPKKYFEELTNLKQVFCFKDKRYDINDVIKKNENESINITISDGVNKPILLKKLNVIMNKNPGVICENNKKFIEDKLNRDEQAFLKPVLSLCKTNDLVIGDKGVSYPIKQMYHFRNIYYILSGKCKFTIFSPSNDFETEYIDKDKLDKRLNINKKNGYKFREIILEEGVYLSVPPHWVVQIVFLERTHIITSKFHTPFSILANYRGYFNKYSQKYKLL